MNDPRLIYSIPEAATMLGISASKAYRYARTGELRTVRFDGRIAVPKGALGEMLEKNGGEPHSNGRGDGAINKVTISGRLTRDAELRTARSGLPLSVVRLAVPKRTGGDSALFVDVVAYGDLAARLADLRKGQPVRITGRLDQREWTTEDGAHRQTYQIVARIVERLDFGLGHRGLRPNIARDRISLLQTHTVDQRSLSNDESQRLGPGHRYRHRPQGRLMTASIVSSSRKLIAIDEAYDRACASDGVSRFGAYLAMRLPAVAGVDPDVLTDPIRWAVFAWAAATPPVMSPGYLSWSDPIEDIELGWKDGQLGAEIVIRTELPDRLVGWRSWERDGQGNLIEPWHADRVALGRLCVRTILDVSLPGAPGRQAAQKDSSR